MADDIVTRLRGYDFMRDGDTPELTMAEAADEIERLRADRDLLRKISDSFSVCPDGCKDCQNQYEEMVNG